MDLSRIRISETGRVLYEFVDWELAEIHERKYARGEDEHMGAYNTIDYKSECSSCRKVVVLEVQFKIGELWQHQYIIGQEIRWGKVEEGNRGLKHFVIDAVAICPLCNEELDYYLEIQENKIIKVQPNAERYEFTIENKGIIKLKE